MPLSMEGKGEGKEDSYLFEVLKNKFPAASPVAQSAHPGGAGGGQEGKVGIQSTTIPAGQVTDSCIPLSKILDLPIETTHLLPFQR